jgi:hypothetical protein
VSDSDARNAPSSPGVEHHIRTVSSVLTLAAGALALAAQVVEHFRKPAAGSNERTKAGTALLGLAVLRSLPPMIRSARKLSADVKRAK